jgi:hypothetical protein
MLSTLYLHFSARVVEANPVMAYFLGLGAFWFIVAKLLSYVPALYVLEWYRRRNLCYGRLITRSAIGAYVAVYLIGFAGANLM